MGNMKKYVKSAYNPLTRKKEKEKRA